MDTILSLFYGCTAALIGVALPGLLNMNAVKICRSEGQNRAIMFSLGTTTTLAIQAYIAVLFARFIDKNPIIIEVLQEIGVVIFACLALLFFWLGKRPKSKTPKLSLPSKKSRFFFGFLLSAINVFPIPYYVALSLWLSQKKVFVFEKPDMIIFVSGVFLGNMIGMYLYMICFKGDSNTSEGFLVRNANYIISAVTAIIALITFFKMIF